MELIEYNNYEQFKDKLDNELQSTTESFVRIGYLLKQARDTDILKESGYETVNDFAAAEYNIDKSQVSRFIRINDRFSEDGNSFYLKDQYREYGYAKLAIMLQLPDEINEELSPEYSKAEIEAIKKEVDAEKEITEIEVMIEETPIWQQDEENLCYKAFKQLLHDVPELYKNLCTSNNVFDTLSPMGDAVYAVRVAGVGRLLISVKDGVDSVVLTNVRSNAKDTFLKDVVKGMIQSLLAPAGTEKEHWEQLYGEEWPIKEIKAAEHTKTSEKKQEKKVEKTEKKSRVTVAKPKKAEVAPVQPNSEHESKKDTVKVEVISGVTAEITDIEKATEAAALETKKAEIIAFPEHTEEVEVIQGEVETPSALENTQREFDSEQAKLKAEYESRITLASSYINKGMYVMAKRYLEYAIQVVEKMNQQAIEEEKR